MSLIRLKGVIDSLLYALHINVSVQCVDTTTNEKNPIFFFSKSLNTLNTQAVWIFWATTSHKWKEMAL